MSKKKQTTNFYEGESCTIQNNILFLQAGLYTIDDMKFKKKGGIGL